MLDTILSDSLAGAYVNSRRSAVFPEMLGFIRKDASSRTSQLR